MRRHSPRKSLVWLCGCLIGGLGAWSALPAQNIGALDYEFAEINEGEIVAASSKPGAASSGTSLRATSALLGMGHEGEIEPNNSSASASPLTGRQGVVRAKLWPAADIDFFAIEAQAGDRLYAGVMTSASAGSGTDSLLRVIAPDGTTIIEADDNDGSFAAASSGVAGTTLAAAGTYFLQISSPSATATMRPYELHYRLQAGTPTAEVEPNDTSATAAPLPANGWVSGTRGIAAATEQDWYSLSLNAGDTVFLSLDLDPERDNVQWDGRLGFGLFGDAGNQILVVNDASTGSVTNPLSETMFMTVKETGTYFAFVDSANAAVGGPTATYQLSVTVQPAASEGLNCTTYTSTDVPVAIGPNPGLATSTITIPGNPRIADLDVSLQLNHAFMNDIDAQLVSPGGNSIGLFTDIGATSAGGQAQMDTVFDDEAAIPPSFTVLRGLALKPELAYRLAWFDGTDAGGTWTLELRDDASTDGGNLTGWSLRVCEAPPPPTCAAGFTPVTVYGTDFEAGAAGFTSSGTANEWELGLPATAGTTTTNPVAAFNSCASGSSCWKTDLDGTYDASSSQDLLSPNIDLSGLQPPVLVRWSQRYQMESASFDRYHVDFRQVGGGNGLRLFEWADATMTNAGGNPALQIPAAAGWSQNLVRADALAGQNTELLFHLDTDTTTNLAGVAIDDVSVTACRALSADLAITKTNGSTTSVPGGSTTYTITSSNAGPDAVTGATVADTFPAVLNCTWTCVGAGGGTCTAAGSGNLNDSVNLPAGGSVTHTATCAIAAAATGTLSNTATLSSAITDPTPANNSATDTDTLSPQADLAITKTDGQTAVPAGGSTTYTITASNAGPSNAPDSTIADTFPAACTSVNWTCVAAGGGSCTAAGSGNLSDTVSLPAGASVSYTASCAISAAASGTLSNTATVSSAVTDPTPGNNAATDSSTLLPPGALGASPNALAFGTLNVGSTSPSQTVTLTNSGGSPLTVSSLSPAAAPFALAGGSCGAVPILLAAGASCTLDYRFSPNVAGPAAQSLTADAGIAGNASIALSGIGGVGSLGLLSSSLDFGRVQVGTGGQLSLTLTNTGSGSLDVTGLSAVSAPFAQVAGGSCGAVPFSIAAGSSCTLLYRFSPTATGSFSQTVTVSSTAGSATASLLGIGFVVTAVDAMDARGLSLLGLILGLVGWVALRRRG